MMLLFLFFVIVNSQNNTLPIRPVCSGSNSYCDKCNPPIPGIDFIKPRNINTYQCDGVYIYEFYYTGQFFDCSRYNINPYHCSPFCQAINSCGKNYVVGYGWVDAKAQAITVLTVIGFILLALGIGCGIYYIYNKMSCFSKSNERPVCSVIAV
jgi:hypothetical protein